MASVFKSDGDVKYTILYTDEHGKRRKKAGYADKRESERLGMKLEERARKIRDGLADPAAEAYRDHAARPLADHLADWMAAIQAKGTTAKHAELFAGRARRIVAVLVGAKLRDVNPPKNAKHADFAKFDEGVSK